MLYDQVAGQEEVKTSLIRSINNDQVSHCYIFEGPKGMGKYELAMVFAQSLFCENFDSDPCNRCPSCIKVNSGNHPDLHIINNSETTIKREEIDSLVESICIKPYESKKKVYIIKAADKMTPQASNTFLKTLEEPSGDAVVILLTTNENLLLPTVMSRCQTVKFRNVSKEKIKKYLKENYHTEDTLSDLAAEYSKGILNKAVNIVNGNDDILKQREEVIKLFDNIVNSDSELIYELESYFEENKDSIDTIIEIIMIWIRDCMFAQNNMDDLVLNKDFKQLAKAHGQLMESSNNLIELMQYTSNNIKSNVNYKLSIDNMLLKIQEVFK
jgi:DNA polymerase-3 subunit delta'